VGQEKAMHIDDFTPGDLVSILGSEKGEEEAWFGEVVDTAGENTLVVSLLEKTRLQGSKIWRFSDVECNAPLASVISHIVPTRPLGRKAMKFAWKKLGFVVGVEDFVRIQDEDQVTLDLADYDSSDSENEDEEYFPDSSDGDVDSDEEFSLVTSDDEDSWVTETHEIAQQWAEWEPVTRGQKRFKAVVDRIEARELRKADEKAFIRGEPAPDFRPKKRRKN